MESVPSWFQDKINNGDVMLINCEPHEYEYDRAFCIINFKNPNKRMIINAGEYILLTEYDELRKIDNEVFNSRYEAYV